MFYPVDSLKRGGRFYLCWVADSWPLQFAAITHKQLWAYDIRKLCDDLIEVMTNESGRPTNRFSLRLSSQLMRGLVRLYEKKVTVLLGDLCMINAHVFKTTNKKFAIVDIDARPLRQVPRLPVAPVIPEEPENEPRLEELIRNSGNVVSNIQDITLKEATIPDFQLPRNDGFGEEHPDQPLQLLLADRTIEMVLAQDASAAQISGLDLPLDSTVKSHDKSRVPHDPQMEMVSDVDMTFRKSTAAGEELPTFEKDIPEIPDIPNPEIPVPTEPVPEMRVTEEIQEVPIQVPEKEADVIEAQAPQSEGQPQQVAEVDATLELEELDAQQQTKKRKPKPKLIIDKKIRLGPDFLRARIANPRVELRCEDSSDAIIDTRTPADVLFRQPAQGGARTTAMSVRLVALLQRNLGMPHPGLTTRHEAQDQETEQPRQQQTKSHTELVTEVQEQPVQVEPVIEQAELDMTRTIARPSEVIPNVTTEFIVTAEVHNVPEESVPNVPMPVDISDLPTQKLETLSQVAQKRPSDTVQVESPAKRIRSGYVSFRESQQRNIPEIVIEEPDKENIPPNVQNAPNYARRVSTMLQEAGLSDIQQNTVEVQVESQVRTRKADSEESETPLGSLDRTKVSLGDSAKTTDSQKFMRNQWGIEGTMVKILVLARAGGPVTIDRLLDKGPLLVGFKKIIAARCFTSILRLKQHGFIKVSKDPESLAIQSITLGQMFYNM